MGWYDVEDVGVLLVYVLLLQCCCQGYCEEFCVYKGSFFGYGVVLFLGFRLYFEVGLVVVVQDQLGVVVVVFNRFLVIIFLEFNGSVMGFIVWLYGFIVSVFLGLLWQVDFQYVIEYLLVLVIVLNEYEWVLDVVVEFKYEWQC